MGGSHRFRGRLAARGKGRGSALGHGRRQGHGRGRLRGPVGWQGPRITPAALIRRRQGEHQVHPGVVHVAEPGDGFEFRQIHHAVGKHVVADMDADDAAENDAGAPRG